MSPEMEHARISGGPRQEGATVGYLFRDAMIGGGAIYAGRAIDVYRRGPGRFVLAGQPRKMTETMLASSKTTEHFFGDWLVEGLSIELLAKARDIAAVSFARPDWLHEPGLSRDDPACRRTG
jgi:hypothetical protein